MDMTGEPFLVQWDPVINYTNGNDFSAVPPYAIHWTGTLRIDEPGKYQFFARTQDQVALKIDGKEWMAAGSLRGNQGTLTKGIHTIDLIYMKPTAMWSILTFEWVKPNGKAEVVPTSAFGEIP